MLLAGSAEPITSVPAETAGAPQPIAPPLYIEAGSYTLRVSTAGITQDFPVCTGSGGGGGSTDAVEGCASASSEEEEE